MKPNVATQAREGWAEQFDRSLQPEGDELAEVRDLTAEFDVTGWEW